MKIWIDYMAKSGTKRQVKKLLRLGFSSAECPKDVNGKYFLRESDGMSILFPLSNIGFRLQGNNHEQMRVVLSEMKIKSITSQTTRF